MEWKWTMGEPCERTPRKKTEPTVVKSNHHDAFEQSFLQSMPTECAAELNKREDFYNKMSEREMICQVSLNPFRTQSTYVEDMMLQDQFLKPINTKEVGVGENRSSMNN